MMNSPKKNKVKKKVGIGLGLLVSGALVPRPPAPRCAIAAPDILADDLDRDPMMHAWIQALEKREAETIDHCRRVVGGTVRLALSLGASDDEIVHYRRGALLHDIGKMSIPNSILSKPGPLTEDEWQIMRMHPVYAYRLLAPVSYLARALPIPYCHHEHWDGSGYPRGLHGEQIPLSARIFSVVDVYDALTSERPYKKAWPVSEVITHLREQSGRMFDPTIVEAFLGSIAA
jgi:HD-GYP domain-containing protein (c-di-GMP phosphodiesterase class II)